MYSSIIRFLSEMSTFEARAKIARTAQRRAQAGQRNCDTAHVRQTVISAQYKEQIRQVNNRKLTIWQNRTRGK